MGVFLAEPIEGPTQTEEILSGSVLKEMKKKKCRSRKFKRTLSACSLVNDVILDAKSYPGDDITPTNVDSNEQCQQPLKTDYAFSSMCSTQMNVQNSGVTMLNQQLLSHESKEELYLSCVSVPTVTKEPVEPVLDTQLLLKEMKKKKCRSRKSKQTLSACSLVNDVILDAKSYPGDDITPTNVDSNEQCQQPLKTDYAFSSMCSTQMNVQNSGVTMLNQQLLSHENKEELYLSCVSVPTVTKVPVEPLLDTQLVDFHDRRTYFPPYRSPEAVNNALKKGELFKALFCVNAYNSVEAYCRIDGLQTDILISGLVAQNRAVEGDTVAIAIDPPNQWPRMKGPWGSTSCSSSYSNHHEALVPTQDSSCVKSRQDQEFEHVFTSNSMISLEDVPYSANECANGTLPDDSYGDGSAQNIHFSGGQAHTSCCASPWHSSNANDLAISLKNLCSIANLYPSKRPTGSVVAIIEKSNRRDKVVGFLSVKHMLYKPGTKKKNSRKNKIQSFKNHGYVLLAPTDPKFTKMMIPVNLLPSDLMKRLEDGDPTIESDLVAAKIVDWTEECHIPIAHLINVFGRGSDIEAKIAAILFENGISASAFSPEVLSCVPCIPWKLPQEESESRLDLRDVCTFTIDPASATDLDDALSVERLPNGHFKVGVHIADVSYFVLPDTAIDIDAKIRSTSVYLLQNKLSMLPLMLSDNLVSLNPGEDRLAVSILFDISAGGEIIDYWIGRTVIRSCSKLSYEHAKDIIEGKVDFHDSTVMVKGWPALYGSFEWSDVIRSVKSLYEISSIMRNNRFRSGAVSIESSKVGFLFDDQGLPCDTVFSGRTHSNFLVEEFMLLANKTAAEVITRAYPSCSLLRRHSEPNVRKLQEFESFCNKHGLKVDFSTSAHLHQSLECIRSELRNDSVLSAILMSYAAKPMQLASYICSGDYRDSGDLGHYALGIPYYTHFTSPLRRYPDIVVHRTLAAVLEAEETYLMSKGISRSEAKERRCFSGFYFNKDEVESVEAQEALSAAASKHKIPGCKALAEVAYHCNIKKLAARHVKDATEKMYIWVLLRRKQVIYCEARVMSVGPKFMSVYVAKLAMERRIYYDEVEGLSVAWLETTSTVVLSLSRVYRKMSRGCRKFDDAVMMGSPCDEETGKRMVEGAFFPMTVRSLSTIPVAVHGVGGDDGPIDVVARLYGCSYMCC